MDSIQKSVSKMIRRLDHRSYKDRLKHLGDIIEVLQYLKGAYEKGDERLFTRRCSNREEQI